MGNFKSDTVPKKWDISTVYNPSQGEQIIEVVHNNPDLIRQIYGLEGVKGCANAILMELRCCASINSLAAVPLPSITDDDSESDRVVKTHSFEWLTDRFELVVFRKAPGQSDWAECGVTALKNSAGHRYRLHRLLDLTTDNIGCDVGEWGRLGVAIQNVGFGLPQIFDQIAVTGSWTQEFTWVEEHPTYVVINQYGGSTPTPTPTPTPAPVPTLTLALATGSSSAVANSDTKITLTVANIPTGTQLTGSWFKDGIDTAISESVTTTGSPIELSTLKLRDKLSGQYSLRLFYNDTGYLSNDVSVTVNPEVSLSLPSGTTSAQTGSFTPITISGKYFPTGTAVTYQWLKIPTDSSGLPSGNFVPGSNGTFTVTQDASIFQAKGSGNYRLAVYVGGNTTPHYSNEISVTQTTVPTVALNRTSADISNYYATDIGITVRGFTVNDVIVTTWFKTDVELPTSSANRTYTHNITNGHYYTWPVNNFIASPYNGAGVYKLRVVRGGVTIFSGNVTISDVRATEQPPALG